MDQHPVVGAGLELLLERHSDIEVSATASDGTTGLQWLRERAIDVVVMDLHLPDMDGVEAIRLYLEERKELPIVIFTEQGEEVAVYRALKAGARGYLLKCAEISELVAAIHEVHGGGYALSAALNPSIVNVYLAHRDEGRDSLGKYQALSTREKQVFRLLAMGRQTMDISEILYISPKTVAKHRAAVKKKLNLANAAQMAQYAIQLGVIRVQ
ncbi:MAG: response regulator [Desulfuromonadales bacterium]